MDKTTFLVLFVNIFLFQECLGQFQLIFGTPTAAPGPGGFNPNCKDKLENCYAFPKENCRAPYEQWAKDYCANTCGYCIGPTTPAPPCQDELSNCDAYDNSICTDPLYKAWANNKCRRRCRFCSAAELARLDAITTTIPPSMCIDKVDCRLFGADACSAAFKDWSKDNCPSHCGYCHGIPTPPPVCKDKIPNCVDYGASVCTKNDYALWVEDNCRKFCGRCGSLSGPSPVQSGGGVGSRIPTPMVPFRIPIPIRGSAGGNSISYAPPTPPAPGKRDEPSAPKKRQFSANHHHGSQGHDCWDHQTGTVKTDDPFCQTIAPSTVPTISGVTDSNQSFNTDFPGHEIHPHPTAPDGWDSKGSQPTKKTEETKPTSKNPATASGNVTSANGNVTSAPQLSSTDTAVVFPSGGPPTIFKTNGTTIQGPGTDSSQRTPGFIGSTSTSGMTEPSSNTTGGASTASNASSKSTSSPISSASSTVSIVTGSSPSPVAANATLTIESTTSPGPTTPPCKDLLEDCRTHDKKVACVGIYKAWARQNCPAFCGFCTVTESRPCINTITNCPEYDSGGLCTAESYRVWAEDHCYGYCGFGNCGGNVTTAIRTTPTTHGKDHRPPNVG